jgi:hypothetical protein
MKESSLKPEQVVSSVAYLLNLTLNDAINVLQRWEEFFSIGQQTIEGESDGARVTHCGALNLTGNTMLLTESNITCPAQGEKDEHGVERYWPAISIGKYGRTQAYSHFCTFCSMVLIAMGGFILPLWYK